jgi:Family of unknown function (DUF5906)
MFCVFKNTIYVFPEPGNALAPHVFISLSEIQESDLSTVFHYVNVSGKMRVIRRVPSAIGKGAMTIEFMTPEEFDKAFVNRKKKYRVKVPPPLQEASTSNENGKSKERPKVKATIVTKTIASHWLGQNSRMTYDGLQFEADPSLVRPSYFNLWSGFAVRPREGDWFRFRDMIFESLANRDEDSFRYIIRWVAWKLQHPTLRTESCIVFRSDPQGTGKGTLGNALCEIFGSHAAHLYRANALVARFNSQLEQCAFLFDDESTFSGDQAAASLMKGLITEPTIDIERKQIDVVTLPNTLGLMKATNSKWSVPAELADRRYAVFETATRFANVQSYWEPIYYERQNGGLSAMVHDLLAMDLGDWHPRQAIPQTDALADQKVLSLKPELQWLLGFLESGMLSHTHANHRDRVIDREGFYVAARRQVKGLSWWSNVQFATFLKGWGIVEKNSHGKYFLFPPLGAMRAEWIKRHPWFKGLKGANFNENWATEQTDIGQVP